MKQQIRTADESLNFILCNFAKIGTVYTGNPDSADDYKCTEFARQINKNCPFTVKINGRLKRCYGRCVGYTRTVKGVRTAILDRIEISKVNNENPDEYLDTLCHELGHAYLHFTTEYGKDCPCPLTEATEERKELEAQLVSCVVLDALGQTKYFDSKEYIESYKAIPLISNENIMRVRWASQKILDLLK